MKIFHLILKPKFNALNFPITAQLKASLSQEARGAARERGGDRPCGREFSAGLIFLCFVSFHQACPEAKQLRGKEMKRLKEPLTNKSKIFTFLLFYPTSIEFYYLMNGLKNIFKSLKSCTLPKS